MRLSRNPFPLHDSDDPAESDLHQMTDDGCPLVLDISSEPHWRDNLGEEDTFGDEVGLRTAVVLSNTFEARNRAEDAQVEAAVRLESNRRGRTVGAIFWGQGNARSD